MEAIENGAGRSVVVGGLVVGAAALAGVAAWWWWTQRGKSSTLDSLSQLDLVSDSPLVGAGEMSVSAMYGPGAKFQESDVSRNGAKPVYSVGKESSTKGAQMEYSFTVHDEDWEYGK